MGTFILVVWFAWPNPQQPQQVGLVPIGTFATQKACTRAGEAMRPRINEYRCLPTE